MTDSDFEAELRLAVELAHDAGAIQMDRYERLERIQAKGPRDVVTEVDHLCEALVMNAVRDRYPGDAFYAEEIGEVPAGEAGAETVAAGPRSTGKAGPLVAPASVMATDRIWIVDPLDGTVNYANGIPFFCVSIGLVVGGRPAVGVVFDPTRNETFAATRNGTPTRNGEAIHVADKEVMEDLVVTFSVGGKGYVRRRRHAVGKVRANRSMGSAALTLAYVACGRFDGYAQSAGLSAWDVVAAGLIAERAGARVTDLGGGPWFDLRTPARKWSCLAASPRNHARFLEMFRGEGGAPKG